MSDDGDYKLNPFKATAVDLDSLSVHKHRFKHRQRESHNEWHHREQRHWVPVCGHFAFYDQPLLKLHDVGTHSHSNRRSLPFYIHCLLSWKRNEFQSFHRKKRVIHSLRDWVIDRLWPSSFRWRWCYVLTLNTWTVGGCSLEIDRDQHSDSERVIMRVHGDRFIVSQHNKGTQCIHSMYSKVVPLSHSVTVSILSTEIDSVFFVVIVDVIGTESVHNDTAWRWIQSQSTRSESECGIQQTEIQTIFDSELIFQSVHDGNPWRERWRPQKLRDSVNEWNGIKVMVLVIMSITTINVMATNNRLYGECTALQIDHESWDRNGNRVNVIPKRVVVIRNGLKWNAIYRVERGQIECGENK